MRGLVLVIGIILISCADEGRTRPEATIPPATSTTVDPTSTAGLPVSEYLPGLEAEFHLPGRAGLVPLIVMVPRGGWLTADPAGFEAWPGIFPDPASWP